MSPHIHPVGTRALLLDLDGINEVMNWHTALNSEPLADQVDCIAAATTLLLRFNTPLAAKKAARVLGEFSPSSATNGESRTIEIDVFYNGEDLDEAAALLGLSPEALIRWHSSTEWTAAFGGFAPGFTYCTPQDKEAIRSIPRRDSPRTAVPAGAVGIAGEFSAVYPRTSPGGWQLIGTTRTPMWDSHASPPALVQPGDRVRYRVVDSMPELMNISSVPRERPSRLPRLELLDAGLLTLFQDRGRPGKGNLGVTPSGAADRASAYTANMAVGNPGGATVLENIGGMTLKALTDTVICVTGAESPITLRNNSGNGCGNDPGNVPVPLARPILLTAGQELTIGTATRGIRSYLAVRGGIVTDSELGSSATDILSGLGPAPLHSGDIISALPYSETTTHAHLSNPLRVENKNGHTVGTLRCVLGPRDDWFSTPEDDTQIHRFLNTEWIVSTTSNRVGLRLESADQSTLERMKKGELPSEGMTAGSIQIPPNGQPVVFMRDHAVTGGYPVIATVIEEDIDIAAQLPPGACVQFICDF